MTVSSILPPGCVELEKDAGVATLHPGEITFAVMARTETNEPGRRINASIGSARPSDASMYGYISEHHGYGKDEVESGDYAEDLAATMLASTVEDTVTMLCSSMFERVSRDGESANGTFADLEDYLGPRVTSSWKEQGYEQDHDSGTFS